MIRKFCLFFIISIIFIPSFSHASTTSGTISTNDRYAWGSNVGWIDFGAASSSVVVTDSELTGYAYGENIGWISLNCSNTSSCNDNPYKVANNNEGTLSGYAWGANVGWIDFAPSAGGVTINSSGVFTGYAYGENIGWINFTTDHPVTTDWRPASTRVSATPTRSSSSGSRSSGGVRVSNIVQQKNITSQSTTTVLFTRSLTIGNSGSDVKNLQQYLNSKGYIISNTGPGSPGNETLFFGALTRKALVRFQKDHNISPAIGYFGPITRGYIQKNP